MKMFSNRTGGIPALIFAVLLATIVFWAGNATAQDYYNNNNYDDGYYDNDYGDYQEFYDDLSPYGQWLNDPQYGYVWTPNAGRDFRPYYTNGHWVMTEYGNMWVSDYPWGWAPFHYGRWAQSAYYGWIWIPGRTWGPAWVNWRQGGGYYGWAPMGPGISISFSFGSGYSVPNAWWTFIPCGNIYSRSYSRYYSPRQTVNIINNTTIINNTYVDRGTRNTYVTGPRRGDVERATRQRVTVYNVNNRGRAGAAEISGRNVNTYRPAIRTVNAREDRPAPRQVKAVERSVITNTGGGRAPSRPATGNTDRRQQLERQLQDGNSRGQSQQRVQRDAQLQQREAQQQNIQRDAQQQRSQREQQLRERRDLQQQSAQQERVQREAVDQQRMVRERQAQQREQQVQQRQAEQQQRLQRDQQMQQQRQMEQQQRMQRDQQMQQQQRQMEQQQRMQREQQMQQQRQMEQQQRSQREQQFQQQRATQQREMQQRNVERARPQPVERSGSAPQQRAVERSSRGR